MQNPVLPRVSVVTPTYNRHEFMPQLLRCVRLQDYPQHLIELLILDDSDTPLALTAHPEDQFTLRVIRSDVKLTLGDKRNHLNAFATGEIIVAFDDDDYYPSTRISHAVERLQSSGLQLAGSSLLFMWFPLSDSLYLLGPYGKNHSCNGAFAYTKAYANARQYDATLNASEEPSFTNTYRAQMVQLEPDLTMLSLAHHHNTVVKPERNFQSCLMPNAENFPQFAQSTWLDFVTDEDSRQFYRSMFKLNS